MTNDKLIENWNQSTPHDRISLINSLVEKSALPDKYKDLFFIDSEYENLPQGFKNWLITNLVEED